MSYSVPTLEELVKQGQDRHRAELPGTDAFLWPNTEHIFIKAVAGLVHLNFQYLEWIKRQRFATEADGDMLDGHGKPFGIERRPATPAHGYVIVTGTPGVTLLAGTQVARSDAVTFSLADDTVVQVGGSVTAYVTADVPGRDGNTVPSTPLSLVSGGLGVTSIVVDGDGLGGGAEIEDDEAYRARILFRMRNPPRGGAAHDYVAWALTIPGVTRVWVDSIAYGPGTVGVWFMTDGSTPNGIPNDTFVNDVTAYIEENRPVTARPLIAAPAPYPVNIEIADIEIPPAHIQALIDAEIADVFRRRVEVSTPHAPYNFKANLLWQAIARVTGNALHTIALPSADIAIPVGSIPIKGSVTYV